MDILVTHWSANLLAVAGYLVAAGGHLLSMRPPAAGTAAAGAPGGAAVPTGNPRRHAVREAVCGQAGLLVALLAVVSPVGYWSQHYMWVRSVQDLLLANVAAALIALGGPWPALRRRLRAGRPGWRWPGGRVAGGPGPGSGEAGGPASGAWPRRPLLVVALFNLAWAGWHLPLLYDAGLTHSWVYAAEIVSYLVLGGAFWRQLIGAGPAGPRLAPLRRVVVLTGTVVVGTILGMFLVFGSTIVYTGYVTAHRAGYAVLADQQTAGAVLWVLMLPAYTIAAVAFLLRWLNDEESEAVASGLDRLLKPAKRAWPSRPGLR
jgi:cytochrome c oxidase assembly factor CtaG